MSYVIDVKKLKTSPDNIVATLVPSQQFSAKDIGKKFLPPMTAQTKVKSPIVTQSGFQMFASQVSSLPSNFVWTSKLGNAKRVRNQGTCGSCWAVSTSTAIADRYLIATNKLSDSLVLSPMSITDCTQNEDCNTGGFPADAAETVARNGIVPDACWPYSCGCQMMACQTPSNCVTYYVLPNTTKAAIVLKHGVNSLHSLDDVDIQATIRFIQTEIYTKGPVVTGFSVPSDLQSIPSSSSYVYQTKTNDSIGWHAVCIIGWGTDSKGLYWIIRNSWGTGFGYGGLFNAYAYPLNNIGFDIPLFMGNMNVQKATRARMLSINPNVPRMLLEAAMTPGAYGGVTIFDVDPKPRKNAAIVEEEYIVNINNDNSSPRFYSFKGSDGKSKMSVPLIWIISIIAFVVICLFIVYLANKTRREIH